MAVNWNRRMPEAVEDRSGHKFVTLKDAANFVSKQAERNEWLKAAGLLMQAAKSGKGADLAAAHKAFRDALFLDGLRLKL